MKVVCVFVLLFLVVGVSAQVILPEVVIVSEFQSATFNCSPLSNFDNLILLEKPPGSSAFTQISPMDERLDTDMQPANNQAVFTYINVTREDNGTVFRCSLGGIESETESTLIVLYPPTYESPGNQTANEGTDLTVLLFIEANPYPANFSWLKDGVDVVPDERVMVGVDYIIFIELITDDAGTYSFNTSNSEGPGPQVSFQLDVQYGPVFTEVFGDNVVCDNSTSDPIECAVLLDSPSASLNCSVTGNPEPNITATTTATAGISLNTDDIIAFTDLSESNAGDYTCTASNNVSTTERTFMLIVGVVPTITNLTVKRVDSNAKVVWEYDNGGVPVQYFRIKFTEEGEISLSNLVGPDQFEPGMMTAQVNIPESNLDPSTTYNVTVSGRNLLGQSNELLVTYTTAEPEGPVDDDDDDDDLSDGAIAGIVIAVVVVVIIVVVVCILIFICFYMYKRKGEKTKDGGADVPMKEQ